MTKCLRTNQTHLHKIAQQPYYILTGKHIGLKNKSLVQRLDNLTNQITSKIEIFYSYECQKRRIKVDFVWHAMNTADQCLCESVSVGSLFQNKWRQELCLQLGKMVISVVSLFITDPNNHELEFVNLADGLLDLLLWLLVFNLSTCLVVHLVRLGCEARVCLHLLSFNHSLDISKSCVLSELIYKSQI